MSRRRAGDGTGLAETIAGHLEVLCGVPGGRLVGTPGNRAATDYVADRLTSLRLDVECPSFACLSWRAGEVLLEAGGEAVPAHPGPYSLPFDGAAVLVPVSTADELERADLGGRIVLLHGELATEPLAPKHYVFYNPEAHRRIYAALEGGGPAAVLAATGTCPATAGAAYPFPVIDDGDFDIPSAYLTDADGELLYPHTGSIVRLRIDSGRSRSTGCNVIGRLETARRSGAQRRVVLTAHVDARPGTPGALDDAAGVATLLAAAELLADSAAAAPLPEDACLELAVLNGEDYYAASGERLYVADNAGRWPGIVAAFNVDGAGYVDGPSAVSFYGVGEPLRKRLEAALRAFPGITPGEPWVQGDHSLFVQQGVPAVAFTSAALGHLAAHVTHTEADRPELVDAARLAELAEALAACARGALADATVRRSQGEG